MADNFEYDVAIAGGGMVGAALAGILGINGVRVAVFEPRQPQRKWEEGSVDLRVSALTLASQNIFKALGVWDSIVERGVSPYREMRVRDFEGEGELHFDGADAGVDIMGHIVENRVTVAALWELMEQLPEVEIFCPARIAGLQRYDSCVALRLDDGRRIKAQLVVGADGKNSAVRSFAGIKVSGWSYHQHAVVAMVTTSAGHRQTAYQRFMPSGPLAFLPLRNGACSIVWSSDSAMAKRNLALDQASFLKALQQASDGMLGTILDSGPRVSFPLSLQFSHRYTDERVALIGDSVHAVHPLAGQGANMGLLDAAALGQLILKARESRRPIASKQVLRAYERWRKGDNLAMLATLDLLNRSFSVAISPVIQLRASGMNLIDRNLPVKNYFNRYAMGLRSDLPELACGQPCKDKI